MQGLRWLIAVIAGVCTPLASAVDQITVEALFSGQAMVQVDGKRRLLKLNKPSPEGVLLISADSHEAVIEVDGERRTYPLGDHVSTHFDKPAQVSAKIWRDKSGAYTTVGTINGRTVNFLVDTGATAIAMYRADAKRLGLAYKLEGTPMYVSTANGTAPAYEVALDRVQVGDIVLHNVQGYVIESGGRGRILLGMSFLNRVRMEDQGAVLMLHRKF
jgi:aspartyl protease family protein